MDTSYNIKVSTFCSSHGIDMSLLNIFQEFELVHIKVIESEPYLAQEELPVVEKMLRLHNDLGINPEGVHAIKHLLDRVNDLQHEVQQLRRKLGRYDN